MSTAVNERPILFSAPMVRAILEGRKSQTRRVVTDKHFISLGLERHGEYIYTQDGPQWDGTFEDSVVPWCPYGSVGERLWVKEKSRVEAETTGLNAWHCIEYAAGGSKVERGTLPGKWFPSQSYNKDGSLRWQSSIHMPRWASRITLEITGVCVERLQDISSADAVAEGMDGSRSNCYGPACPSSCNTFGCYGPREQFEKLWQSINGPDSWAANPFVWVVEFRRIDQ